jgi:hypothetical protein
LVIPHSVSKKNNKKPMVLQMGNAQKKKNNSRWKYTNEIIPSVFPTVNHQRNYFVGDCGIRSKYFATLSKIPMKYIYQYKRR